MSLSIENFIENKIWNEWTQRMSILKKYNIRKKYYPNNISYLESLERDLVIKRRNSVKYAISYRDKMIMDYQHLTSEEKEQWESKCKKIKNIDFEKFIMNNKVQDYFDEIGAYEYERLMTLKNMTFKRYEEERLREAAEALIMLHKISNEEVKNEKKKLMKEKQKEKQEIRRSCRLARK